MKPRVILSELPGYSRLLARVKPGDFLDCYAVKSDLSARAAAGIITDFPSWARLLIRLRALLTAPFGLSQDGPVAEDKLGAFPVEYESQEEVVAGFNDKHLDFRISVCAHQGQVYLATWVHRNNLAGRIYLALIMPFHIMIARNALARVAR